MHADLEPPGAPSSPPPPVQFVPNAPLGGIVPQTAVPAARSDRRDLVLTAALLVLSVVAGATSLMPWRDFGRRLGAPMVETGWEGADGTMGRGWIAVALAVLVAGAGVLIAADKARFGRVLAVLSGTGLAVLAVAEWGLGEKGLRTGPGIGLWVAFAVGVLVVVAVGALTPGPEPAPPQGGT